MKKAFTIVELLVVIVVIGILAAITIISYTGISSKATVSSLQSDLSSAKKQLNLYYVDHSAYPASINNSNCPLDSVGTADTKYCIKPSGSNTFTYISSSPYSTFSLSSLNSSTRYSITNDTSPVLGGWIAGIAATALANKWIYSVDVSGYKKYKTSETAVTSAQGVTGLDTSPYDVNISLFNPQTNPNIDFSDYPAQNSCKAIGGRLPNMNELSAIYNGRFFYNVDFQTPPAFWSATQDSSVTAYLIDGNGSKYSISKLGNEAVRCVAG